MRTCPWPARAPGHALLVAALAAAGGCGSDRGVGPPIPAAEAELLVVTLVDVAFDALFRGISEAVAGEASGADERVVEVTVACAGGGEATLSGLVTGTVEPSATYEVEVVADLELRSCRRDGAVLHTAAAEPPLDLHAALAALNGEPVGDQVVEIIGRVGWTAEAAAGSVICEVDLAAAHDPVGRTRVAQGAACGRELEVSYGLEE